MCVCIVMLLIDFVHCSPIFTNLAGKTSILKAVSPAVLEASFNVGPDLEKALRSKRMSDAVFFPPPN